ncbi:MAG TPA: hypothetical protein VGM60_11045 [Pseudonocardia sp.]
MVRLLAEGTSGREIARRPHLSPGTVRNCLGHVMTRWDARTGWTWYASAWNPDGSGLIPDQDGGPPGAIIQTRAGGCRGWRVACGSPWPRSMCGWVTSTRTWSGPNRSSPRRSPRAAT